MQDIPVDISNKKYLSPEPQVVNEPQSYSSNSPKVDEPSVTPVRSSKPIAAVKVKRKMKPLFKKEDLQRLIDYLKRRWQKFKTVEYPIIYGKLYDINNFRLVENRFMDISLKVLILLTLLILLLILILIVREVFRLMF